MATITTILGTDNITDSRSVINTNFDNLNTDKLESSDIAGKQNILSEGAFVNGDKTKLDGISIGANVGVVPNASITGATKTKITYDAKGLVTSGTDATTADIADSSNKRYVTDAQLTVIGNTSNTNSGDQTITLTGDVTGTGTGTFATTLANTSVTPGSYILSAITVDSKGRITSASSGSPSGTPLTTKGDLLTFDTTDQRLGVGTNGQVLTADSTVGVGIKWATVSGSGDVVGPASAVDSNIAAFDTTTGKLIKDGGTTIAAITTKIEGIILTSADTDTITTGGRYRMIGTPTNGPIAGEFALDVTNDGAGRIMQIATYTNSSVYTRVFSGTWTAWVKYSDDNKQNILLEGAFINGDKTKLDNQSGTNTGDETTSTIKTKLGAATTSADGYLTSTDWNTFNSKAPALTSDDNYVTDAEKVVIGNTSGTNTGDNTVATALTGTPSIKVATVTTTGNIELGNATDTTLSRVSAGVVAIEGVNILLNGGALGTPASGTLTNCTFPTLNQNTTGTASNVTGTVAIANGGTGATTLAGASIPTYTSTNTFTNKRITKRVSSATSYTTDTGTSLNCDNLDTFIVTAQAGALKLNNPSGTPTDGQLLMVAITGTAARALTYDTQYEASTISLPTTTVTTARLNMLFCWRADTSKWVCIAVA